MDKNKLKQIAEEFKSMGKPVALFAILKMDEHVDKWSFVFSASWIKPENKENFIEILNTIRKYLQEEDLKTIARVGLFLRSEHLIEELLKKDSGDVFENTKINGNFIHKGYIVISNSEL